MRRTILKIKKKTVKLIIASFGAKHLYTGIMKEDDSSIKIREVVAGSFTGATFTFSKSLIRIKYIGNTVNYYISEKDVSIDSK